jgi:hypothetical protein
MLESKNEASIEVMKKKRHTMDSPLPNAGNENMNVYNSFCSPLNLLNILSNLVTLMTLKILAI